MLMLTRSRLCERIAKIAPAIDSAAIPRINAPAIPRTHSHARRRLVSGLGEP